MLRYRVHVLLLLSDFVCSLGCFPSASYHLTSPCVDSDEPVKWAINRGAAAVQRARSLLRQPVTLKPSETVDTIILRVPRWNLVISITVNVAKD